MTTVLLFGVLSALVQFWSWQSDGRAADDTEQLVLVQEIQSSLLRADALATNAFLAGANAEGDQQEEYDAAVASVFAHIAEAAEAQSADREALAALNVAVNDYATAVAEARVNNRQGFPVGAEYLNLASEGLRADAIPILANLAEANGERAEDAMGGQQPVWLVLIGIAALVVLVRVNQVLARQFRRRINVGVAVAALVVLLTTVVSAAAAARGSDQNDDLLGDELRSAVDQAAARTAANDAKANESLRLIKRGSGEVFEAPWRESAAVVEDRAAEETLDEWAAYAESHAEIVALDDEDRWLLAREIAIGDGEDDSTRRFAAFDDASDALVGEMAETTTEALRSGRGFALAGSLLTLALGFVAAVAVARGIGARRREYA
ncbi:hypothetical protein [Nocardioides sp. TF02-7]|uniref:hypothetical protein n=1 Tax=Nocardioides sp. TF02-7 TaxID=2917724 RepID=UPI001F05B0EF|nr:hypothetical protein [Nocardioides sp. TF02-7]UMG93108.1 hypothetical protein MF408_01905 [Nocardioides sp. TF02-7]